MWPASWVSQSPKKVALQREGGGWQREPASLASSPAHRALLSGGEGKGGEAGGRQ